MFVITIITLIMVAGGVYITEYKKVKIVVNDLITQNQRSYGKV